MVDPVGSGVPITVGVSEGTALTPVNCGRRGRDIVRS